MVDISSYPYFSHGNALNKAFEDITSQVNLRILSFKRIFSNMDRIYIISHPGHILDYFQNEFYKYAIFENHPSFYQSSFHMWDHLPCDPNGIYSYLWGKYQLTHGLTIVQKHEEFCDFFMFASPTDDALINNYYIDQKENFIRSINKFYIDTQDIIEDMGHHRLWMPSRAGNNTLSLSHLSKRQSECASLFLRGWTAKQIARELSLSHRTAEEYLNNLKKKFDAPNRIDLAIKLDKFFKTNPK